MKIGMNLLLYTTQPDESIFPICDRLQGYGFDALEWPLLGSDHAMAERIGKFNRERGLLATAVFAFGPGTSPISDDAAERAAATAAMKDRIELCQKIGGTHLVGPFVQTLGGFSGAPPTETERSRAVEYLQEVGDHAAKHDVTLCVEFLNRFEIYLINTAKDTVALLDRVNHPSVKAMYDSFHAHIEEKSQYDAIQTIKPYLAHVHVSENDRGVPGSGTSVRWDDYFRGLKDVGYDGHLTIESFGQALPDLAAAARIWRPLFDHAEDVPTRGIEFIRSRWHG